MFNLKTYFAHQAKGLAVMKNSQIDPGTPRIMVDLFQIIGGKTWSLLLVRNAETSVGKLAT